MFPQTDEVKREQFRRLDACGDGSSFVTMKSKGSYEEPLQYGGKVRRHFIWQRKKMK